MSYLDDASLVMIPSGYKDGKLYSVKPSDGAGDFTFTRGSNLAATRVDENGLIEKGRENLLTYSNDFSNVAWFGAGVSKTGGQSGYDGSSDAWLLTSSINYTSINLNVSSSGVHTFSAYLKDNNIGLMQLYVLGSSFGLIDIDLTAGIITGQAGTTIIDKGIESVGNGWYRAYIVVNDSITRARIVFNDLAGTSFYIQDAQLEAGLVATDYIETGATTAQAGILEDMPRLDYSGGSPALLLEPQRTNLLPHSEYFQNYSRAGALFLENATTSPEGVANATTFEGDGTLTYIRAAYSVTFASAGDYTISVFAKAGTNNFILLNFEGFTGASGTILAYFDLSNGTTPTSGASIKSVGTDGWYRCSISATIDAGDLGGNIVLLNTPSASSVFFSTTGDADGKSVYIYGWQVEQGSYATSYIPTYGTSVTRGAEGQSYSGFSSLIGQTEGTLFLEIDGAENTTEIFSLNRSTANSIFLFVGSNTYRTYIWSDGITYSQDTSIANTDRIKIAIAYKSNDFAIYANGSQVSTNNTLTWTPNTTIDSLNFNVGGYIVSKNLAQYKQVLVFKERLSNADLATLTTL